LDCFQLGLIAALQGGPAIPKMSFKSSGTLARCKRFSERCRICYIRLTEHDGTII